MEGGANWGREEKRRVLENKMALLTCYHNSYHHFNSLFLIYYIMNLLIIIKLTIISFPQVEINFIYDVIV